MSPAMIDSLRIKNAQRHIAATLEFVDGVNAIRGATDSGKSTIIRVLRWVCFNKPASSNLLRRGTKRTDVEIVFDGHTICRSRTKSKNIYILDGKEKQGFGKHVPEDIAKLLDMDDTLHMQRQSDPYFLLAVSSPTERAKELERFTDLSVITRSIQKGRRVVRDLESKGEVIRAQRRERRKERNRLARFFSKKESIMLVFSLSKELDKQVQLLKTLIEKRSIMQRLYAELAKTEKAVAVDVSMLQDALSLYREDHNMYSELVTLRDKLVTLHTRKRITDQTLHTLQLDALEKDIAAFTEDKYKLECLQQIRERMLSLTDRKQSLEEEEDEIGKALKKIKVCKACGRPLDETSIRGNR